MKIEDYNKYYIQGSDHYLIPKDVFKELFNEMINWKEENKILKENAENNDKVVDKVNWENMLLKQENKQLKQKYEMQKYSNKLLCKAITCDDCNCKVCEAHKDNIELKKDIKNIIRILNKNCDDLEATEEEFKSLKRWENE